jgi:hypothetical protein
MPRALGDVRNDRKNAVTKFCLAMEEHRRSDVGRLRTAREMLDFFFQRTASGVEDRLFVHLPAEVRGPIVAAWGIRGAKSAVRDSDDKIRQVVLDALAAGDIDDSIFEDGITAQTLVDWTPLTEWWSFWRTGKLTGVAIQKALAVGRELGLFDDAWFLLNVEGRGGKLKGTDTLCDTLSKDQIVGWVRKVHESGDGSPAGLVGALGWETILTKTSQESLLFALDALARKVGLAAAQPTTAATPARGNGIVAVAPSPPASAATAPPAASAATTPPVASAATAPLPQAMATEMPGGGAENLAVPNIPNLDPPKLAPIAPLTDDASMSAVWAALDSLPAQAPPATASVDEPPSAFREVEVATADYDPPAMQAPSAASTRKAT